MSKKIRIEITSSGEIKAKTLGMYGEECLDYVEVIEQMADAQAVDSTFTEDYYKAHAKRYVKQQQDVKRK